MAKLKLKMCLVGCKGLVSALFKVDKKHPLFSKKKESLKFDFT